MQRVRGKSSNDYVDPLKKRHPQTLLHIATIALWLAAVARGASRLQIISVCSWGYAPDRGWSLIRGRREYVYFNAPSFPPFRKPRPRFQPSPANDFLYIIRKLKRGWSSVLTILLREEILLCILRRLFFYGRGLFIARLNLYYSTFVSGYTSGHLFILTNCAGSPFFRRINHTIEYPCSVWWEQDVSTQHNRLFTVGLRWIKSQRCGITGFLF